jgi:hypothetical protein
MRVLLDECLPRKLKLELTGHDAKTVSEMGWAGLKNGELLRAAARQFDAFITVDRNLPAQQRVDQLPFGVIVLGAPRNSPTHAIPTTAAITFATGVTFQIQTTHGSRPRCANHLDSGR